LKIRNIVKLKQQEVTTMAFMLKQRAFLKLYVMDWIAHNRGRHGYEMLEFFRREFAPFGYSPTHSELYTVLKELYQEERVTRMKKLRGIDPKTEFQEIVIYELTTKGKEYLESYKKLMKVELDRCDGLLRKALRDIYS
jgi:DNA-binding PadR family transcriptional regulator